jgi:hypothetical protein
VESRPDLGRWSTTGRLHQGGDARRHDEGPGGYRTPSASAIPAPLESTPRLERRPDFLRREERAGSLNACFAMCRLVREGRGARGEGSQPPKISL